MTTADPWVKTIFDSGTAEDTWSTVFTRLKDLATSSASPVELHNRTIAPDRLLAESAWELWQAHTAAAKRTSQVLQQWWSRHAGATGRAVLILDALSLRELAPLLGGAEAHGISPTSVDVTGSEMPSDTDQFAKALGVPSRSSLKNNAAPAGFVLSAEGLHTDVLDHPFEDCVGSVPNNPNVLLWHTWLDDLIHVHRKLPDQIYKQAARELQSEGFWNLVNRLRQGRRLAVTSDHGYAVAKLFSSQVTEEDAISALRDVFGASRRKPDSVPWTRRFMPPVVLTENGHHIVMGQRKWKVQGGFPHVDHGGLTLLETAVPFVEFPPL